MISMKQLFIIGSADVAVVMVMVDVFFCWRVRGLWSLDLAAGGTSEARRSARNSLREKQYQNVHSKSDEDM
jgi:hypothetical protein